MANGGDRPKLPRLQSQESRDAAELKRRQTQPRGVPVVPIHEFDAEDYTDRYEGEELAKMRARRPTDKRIGKLERKHDDLAQTVTEFRVEMAPLPGLVEEIRDDLRKDRDRKATDDLDAKKNRRERITRLIGLLTSGVVLSELVHLLGRC